MSRYRLMDQSGARVGPPFDRYVDAFNYRASQRIAAMILEEPPAEREIAADWLEALRDPNSEGPAL